MVRARLGKEGGDLVHILDAGRAFDARGDIDQRRAGARDRLGDIVRVSPPESAQGSGWRKPSSSDQSNRRPIPPGSAASSGVLAS